MPLLLISLANFDFSFLKQKRNVIYLFTLFIPLIIVIFSGGASKRFSEISIFTDPTISTEINSHLLISSGANLQIGSRPSFISRLAYNKPVYLIKTLANNLFNTLSTNFLFVSGDSNPRHSVSGWGLLLKTEGVLMVLGLIFIILKYKRLRSAWTFVLIMTFSSILPSSLTRDGGNHATRLFMLVLPAIILSSVGMYSLFHLKPLLAKLLLVVITLESLLFFQSYFLEYPYTSQLSWHAGLKEVILAANKHKDQPTIISFKYEWPLIFYLYYSDFSPARLQNFIKNNSLYSVIDQNQNLEGSRFGDTDVYFAILRQKINITSLTIPHARYYVTANEIKDTPLISTATPSAVTKLPSGEPLFYEIPN